MKYLLTIILFYSSISLAYDYSNSTIKKENAYGPGIHMDQYGRAVKIQPKSHSSSDPFLKIKENTYGDRSHSDQYGRPVTIKPYGSK